MSRRKPRKTRREARGGHTRAQIAEAEASSESTWDPVRLFTPAFGAALAVAVLALLAFANTVQGTLVHDDKFFVPLPAAVSDDPWSVFFRHVWAHTAMPSNLYRPLLMLSLLLDGWLGGGSVTTFRLTNIALHVAASLLVYLLALIVLRRAREHQDNRNWLWAGIAAGLFALHPIHTEAVSSIFNRSDTLVTVCVLLGLWAIVRSAIPTGWAWGVANVAFFLGLLSKETAVAFPLLAVLMVSLLTPQRGVRDRVRELLPMLGLLVPLVVYLWLRGQALGGLTAEVPVYMDGAGPPTPFERIGRSLAIIVQSLRMVVFPHPLLATYDDIPVPSLWLIALVLVGLAGLVAYERKRGGMALTLASGFFVLALLPAARPVGSGAQLLTAAERFVYLPSVGCALALPFLLRAAVTRWGLLPMIVPVWLIGLAFFMRCWTRSADWHSDLRLWQAEHRSAPHSDDAMRLLSVAMLNLEQNQELADLCDAELPQRPRAAKFALHCGAAYHRLKRLEEAEGAYLIAAKSKAMWGMPHTNLARIYLMMNRRQQAEEQVELAIAESPSEPQRLVRRAFKVTLLYPKDAVRLREAEAGLVQALELQPGFAEAEQRLQDIRRTLAQLE